MLLALINILTVAQELGLARAIVYFDEDEESLRTYHTTTILMGALITGCTIVAAPLVSSFYDTPALTPLMRWLGLMLLLGGIRATPQGLMEKQFRFKELVAFQTIASVISGVVAVIMAWMGAGAMSLVVNMLLGTGIHVALVCWRYPPRLTFRLRREVIRRALRWSLPLAGSRMVTQVYVNADAIIVGKMLGSAELGFYSLALRLASFIGERVFGTVGQVGFPSFASLKDDRQALVRHWLALTEVLALISFPAMMGLAVAGEDLIIVLVGAKWLPTLVPLPYLCLAAGLRTVQTVLHPLVSNLGRTDLSLYYNILSAAVLPVGFVAGCYSGGLLGVGIVWACLYPLLIVNLVRQTLNLLDLSWGAYFGSMRFPLLVTLVCGVAMLSFNLFLHAGLLRLALKSGLPYPHQKRE